MDERSGEKEENGPSGRRGMLARRNLLLAPGFLVLLSAFVPLLRRLNENDFDWPLVLNELHGGKIAFGRDIVFTYGPWGFIWGGYHPNTFFLVCLVWMALALVAWQAILQIIRARIPESRPWRTGALALLIAIPFAGDQQIAAADVRMFMFAPLLLISHFFIDGSSKNRVRLLLATALGFLAMVKFTYLVTGLIAVAFVTLDQLFVRRDRKPIVLPAFLLSALLAWVGAGQSLYDLPAFLRWSIEVTAGYSEPMNLWSPNEPRQVLMTILTIISLLLLLRMAAKKIALPKRRGFLAVSGTAILLLLIFRAGFVRHDLHELITTGVLLALMPIALVLAAPASFSPISGGIPRFLVLSLTLITSAFSFHDWADESLLIRLLKSCTLDVSSEAIELARVISGKPSQAYDAWQKEMAATCTQTPLPPMDGRFDTFPGRLTILFANHLNYAPRPTLKSYSAYTPLLSELNAAKLRSRSGPDHLLVQMEMLNNRLPMMDDGRSWLTIFTHFQFEDEISGFLHLLRRPVPRSAILSSIAELPLTIDGAGALIPRLNTSSAQPPLLWARIELRRTASGSVIAQLYKPPPLYFAISTQGGANGIFRVVPANAADGFLLGPVIVDNRSFRALLDPASSSTSTDLMPRTIRLLSNPHVPTSWYFDASATLRLYSLSFD